MIKSRKVTATYDADAVKVRFSGWSMPYDEGDDLDGIEVETVTILGVTVDYSKLPDDLQTAISILSDEVEFEND